MPRRSLCAFDELLGHGAVQVKEWLPFRQFTLVSHNLILPYVSVVGSDKAHAGYVIIVPTKRLETEALLKAHLPVKPSVLDQVAQNVFVKAGQDTDADEDE